MSATTIKAYWPLLKKAVVPPGIMKIILSVLMVCFVSAFVVTWFMKGDFSGAAHMLLMAALIHLIFMLIPLPNQALTTISSKSLRYLADFRKFYFIVAIILSMLFPIVAIAFKWVSAEPAQDFCMQEVCVKLKSINDAIGFGDLFYYGSQVWLLSSTYVIGLFFAAYRFPLFQGMIFFTFALIGPLFKQLSQWNFLQLILASILLWVAFGLWWLRLKPKKYFTNFYEQNIKQITSAGTTANPSVNPTAVTITNLFAPSSKPASFLGTRLIGMPDGNSGIFRLGVLCLMMSLLLLVFFKWIYGNNFQNVMQNIGIGFVFYIAIAGSYGFLTAICRNIKSSWLFYTGSRSQLFQFIEKRCFDYSIKMMWVTPILAILINQLVENDVIDLPSFVAVGASVFIGNALTFYLTISIYSRDNDDKMGVSVWQVFSLLFPFIVLGLVCAAFKVDHHVVAVSILAVMLLISFFLRRSLLKKWQTINFVRVG